MLHSNGVNQTLPRKISPNEQIPRRLPQIWGNKTHERPQTYLGRMNSQNKYELTYLVIRNNRTRRPRTHLLNKLDSNPSRL